VDPPAQLLGARRVEADVEMVAVAARVFTSPPKTCESQRVLADGERVLAQDVLDP